MWDFTMAERSQFYFHALGLLPSPNNWKAFAHFCSMISSPVWLKLPCFRSTYSPRFLSPSFPHKCVRLLRLLLCGTASYTPQLGVEVLLAINHEYRTFFDVCFCLFSKNSSAVNDGNLLTYSAKRVTFGTFSELSSKGDGSIYSADRLLYWCFTDHHIPFYPFERVAPDCLKYFHHYLIFGNLKNTKKTRSWTYLTTSKKYVQSHKIRKTAGKNEGWKKGCTFSQRVWLIE